MAKIKDIKASQNSLEIINLDLMNDNKIYENINKY